MLEGLHPNRPTHVLRLETTEREAHAMVDLLGETFDPAETAVASFEKPDESGWLLEAYFAHPPDEAAIRTLIQPIIGDRALSATFHAIAKQDWIAASLEGLHPVRAGRFLVHGAHDRDRVQVHDWALEIEAALAFGTGHHGTTKGCLLALERVLKQRRPRFILDVGSGTGILALAAAKGARRCVIAGDIDPLAVEVAKGNAALNGLVEFVRFYTGPGIHHPSAHRSRHFDLVFANILARPLRLLAPSLASVLAPHGTLILSGLLPSHVNGVLAAYRAQGLFLHHRMDVDGWSTLMVGR